MPSAQHMFSMVLSLVSNNGSLEFRGRSPSRREVCSRGKLAGTPSATPRTDTQGLCPQVQQGGPAAKAGLEDEDVIVQVNGEDVQHEPYDRVVDRIKSSGEHVTLLVCGKNAYGYFQAKKIPIVSSMADTPAQCPDGKGETSAELECDHMVKERVSGDPLPWGTVPMPQACLPVTQGDQPVGVL